MRGGMPAVLAVLIAACALAAGALAAPGGLRAIGCIDAPPAAGSDDCDDSADGLDSVADVAISPDGRSLYAAGLESDAIVRFRRDRESGDLTTAGCIEDEDTVAAGCAAVNGGLDAPIDVDVSPDGRSVYALSSNDDSISIFGRNPRNGRLTPGDCVADDDIAPSLDDCPGASATSLEFPSSLAISPDGRHVYAASIFDGGIEWLRRKRSGALVPKGCIDDNSGPEDCAKTFGALASPNGLALSPDGRWLYAAASGEDAVVQLRRNKRTGALNARGCVADNDTGPGLCVRATNGLDAPRTTVLGPEGRSLYALSGGDRAVVRMRRSPRTGRLRPSDCIDDWAGVDTCERIALVGNPVDGVVSPDGRSLYVAAFDDDSVAAFSRNRRSGAIASLGCTSDEDGNGGGPFEQCSHTAGGLNGIDGIALSPDGRFLHTGSQQDDAVAVFRRR
jgi:6-phosphogluconolactonase (cycloisomerase 2 family)